MEDLVERTVVIPTPSNPASDKMLFPAEVVPFFQHDDPGVRRHAIDYFSAASDVGPLTADHYWECLDRFGNVDPAFWFAVLMKDLPQTDNSLDRLFQALAAETPRVFATQYKSAIFGLPLDMVARHREKIFACPALEPHVRNHLESRLALLNQSPASAWDRLVQYGNEVKDEYSSAIDGSMSDSLVEAAARGGEEICQKALALLRDENVKGEWTEIFAVRVLGMAKYEPAIPTLVSLFAIDTDVLRDDTNRALARIGTPRVAQEILAFYPGKPWHVRLYAHSHISKIKRPESVDALMKLLEIEQAVQANPDCHDDEGDHLKDQILIEVTDLCSLAGLEASRTRIQAHPSDPELSELRERLIATAIMRGHSLPEEPQWLKLRAEARKRQEARAKSFERLFGNSQEARPRRAHSTLDAPPLGAQATRPIRNTAPKIGRNDPCTCGSGKKYKKCCGK